MGIFSARTGVGGRDGARSAASWIDGEEARIVHLVIHFVCQMYLFSTVILSEQFRAIFRSTIAKKGFAAAVYFCTAPGTSMESWIFYDTIPPHAIKIVSEAQ